MMMTNDIKNSNNYDDRHILTTRHHHHHNSCPNESLDGNAQIYWFPAFRWWSWYKASARTCPQSWSFPINKNLDWGKKTGPHFLHFCGVKNAYLHSWNQAHFPLKNEHCPRFACLVVGIKGSCQVFPPCCPIQPSYNPYIGGICCYICRVLSQGYPTFPFDGKSSQKHIPTKWWFV